MSRFHDEASVVVVLVEHVLATVHGRPVAAETRLERLDPEYVTHQLK